MKRAASASIGRVACRRRVITVVMLKRFMERSFTRLGKYLNRKLEDVNFSDSQTSNRETST
jgi:hypothetical protein